ncbi:RING/U-box superfamily protein [Striga asiatica]|uniref:RING-type E3 ubiquitin transferase n=1 Tax=Striga asiatica TaxID=4170 RepID=A0A5A7R3Y7_STRAF|nr:RING/U-box superfamily protein [Striga asiatica]
MNLDSSFSADFETLTPALDETGAMAQSRLSPIEQFEPDTIFQLNGATIVRMPRLYTGRVLTEADFARIDVSAILSLGSRLRNPQVGPTSGLQEEEISKYLEIRSSIIVGDEKTVCAICLDNVCGKEDMVTIVEGCGHKFHTCCLRRWLPRRNICPLCRRIVISVPS